MKITGSIVGDTAGRKRRAESRFHAQASSLRQCARFACVFSLFALSVLVVLQARQSIVVQAGSASVPPSAQLLTAGEQGIPLPQNTQSPIKFATAVPYNSGGYYASSVALADLNGDGKLDLVVANSCESNANGKNCDAGTVSVLLGNGNGTFQQAVIYGSGGVAGTSVAIADVNGDGYPDLVMASQCVSASNCDNGLVGVLLGKGDGTFQPAVSYNAGYVPVWVAIADVNGDGFPDLIVANQSECDDCKDGGVSILLNNGNDTFQAPVTYSSAGPNATSVAVADVNQDGYPDLVIANESMCVNCPEGGIAVLLGNGSGSFQLASTYDSGAYAALSVAIADVNGDGIPDIIVTNLCERSNDCQDGIVGVMLGVGNGTFQPPVAYNSGGYGADSIAIRDVNGDGIPDLVVGNVCPSSGVCNKGAVSVLLGNGDGTFQTAVVYKSGGWDAASVAVGDLNGNGTPDIVAANCEAYIHAWNRRGVSDRRPVKTRDLRSHIHAEIIEKGKLILQERVKSEMHQSVVEVGTSVCANIKEAREELKKLRHHMIRLAARMACVWLRPQPILLRTGACRKLRPTSATRILSRICNWWPGRI
jgi:hypothetical protein